MTGGWNLRETSLFLIQETNAFLETTSALAEDSELEQNAVGPVFSSNARLRDVAEKGLASGATPIQYPGSNTQIQQEQLYALQQMLALRCQRHPCSARVWMNAYGAIGGENGLHESNDCVSRGGEKSTWHFLLIGPHGLHAQTVQENDGENRRRRQTGNTLCQL